MKKVYISEEMSYKLLRKKYIAEIEKIIAKLGERLSSNQPLDFEQIYNSDYMVISTPENEIQLIRKQAFPIIKKYVATGLNIDKFFVNLNKLGLDDLKRLYFTHYRISNDEQKTAEDEKFGRV